MKLTDILLAHKACEAVMAHEQTTRAMVSLRNLLMETLASAGFEDGPSQPQTEFATLSDEDRMVARAEFVDSDSGSVMTVRVVLCVSKRPIEFGWSRCYLDVLRPGREVAIGDVDPRRMFTKVLFSSDVIPVDQHNLEPAEQLLAHILAAQATAGFEHFRRAADDTSARLVEALAP